MAIPAIETIWNGYRFRSRLEARWAIVLHELGLTFEYEPEGFNLDGVLYLPDFYVPALRWWVEIKPTKPEGADAEKCARFGAALRAHNDEARLRWAPDDPRPEGADENDYVVFVGSPGEAVVVPYHGETPGADQQLAICALCDRLIVPPHYWPGASREENGEDWDMYHCEWCDTRDRLSRGDHADRAYFHKGDVVVGYDVRRSPRLAKAYLRARQARFEHGERP